jgi:hypothetical protein
MLNEAELSITEPPLDAYALYGEGDGIEVEEGASYGQDIMEKIDTVTGKKKITLNYTKIEDNCLVRAWSQVSIDAVHDIDQIRKRCWQRIEDKFFHLMPRIGIVRNFP